jgi:hypothetical protein
MLILIACPRLASLKLILKFDMVNVLSATLVLKQNKRSLIYKG